MYWNEVTTGIYPWDVHDEGIDVICENLRQEAGCNAAYLIALMHHEKRPYRDNYYPHNPRRKRYICEDSRIYWHPDPARFRDCRIQPLGSDRDWLKGRDWLEHFCTGLRRHGMKPSVELSHTPVDRQRNREQFADCVQVDIDGTPVYDSERLCWNSADARQLMCCMAQDVVARYDVEVLQTCTFAHTRGAFDVHPLLGICLGSCFCANCERAARAQGLDWDGIRARVRYWADVIRMSDLERREDRLLLDQGINHPAMMLIEEPLLYDWLQFRCRTFTAYLAELSAAAHAVRDDIIVRFNVCYPDGETAGIDLKSIAPHIDQVRQMHYPEQSGDIEQVRDKGRWLATIRRQVGEEMPVIASVGARAAATPETIKLGIKLAAKAGADGLSFAFYDGASMTQLRAIKAGLEEADIVVG